MDERSTLHALCKPGASTVTYNRTTSFDDETTTAAASLSVVLRRPAPTVSWRDRSGERAMLGRPWVGNVRELRNVMDRVASLGPAEALDGDAPSVTRTHPAHAPRGEWAEGPVMDSEVPFKVLRDQWLDHLERAYLTALIARNGRNITAVDAAAGLDRSYIHRLIKKHDL